MSVAGEDVSVREKVLDLIRRYPGLHVREVERQLGVSPALASYHLRRLAEGGLLRAETHGEFLRYYPAAAGAPRAGERRLLAILRRPVAAKIALLLLSEGALANKDIALRLGISRATVSYHLHRLSDAGLLQAADERGYELSDPDRVRRLLASFPPAPGILEEFADLWEDLYGP
ncbi:MAG TPA: ArsR family transcriptional regulator [Candidatus Thermoplasmatota archaeon]|nr:ArsR family transcriptional regulator [Candidatus Thermoplasmatota archaeon]